jgi:DNA-binding PadR family transcriptional regulator
VLKDPSRRGFLQREVETGEEKDRTEYKITEEGMNFVQEPRNRKFKIWGDEDRELACT